MCVCVCVNVSVPGSVSVSASAVVSVCTRKFVLCVHAQVCALQGLISHLLLLLTCARTCASFLESMRTRDIMTLNATPCSFLATPAATLATGGCASTTVTRFNRLCHQQPCLYVREFVPSRPAFLRQEYARSFVRNFLQSSNKVQHGILFHLRL